MPDHPLLEQFESWLKAAIPEREVQLSGHWSTSSRRTYASEAGSRTGSEAYVDVLDRRWHGAIAADRPHGAIAFLLHHGELHWAKSPDISGSLGVELSLHSYLDFRSDRATFACNVGGAVLPGVPVSISSELPGAAIVSEDVVTSGRVIRVARATEATLFAVLIPGELLKTGRKRVWHIRDGSLFEPAPDVRAMLTHGRTGTIRADDTGSAHDGR